MPSIIVRDKNHMSRVLKSKPFLYEDVLQRNVAELPNVIPLDSVMEEAISHVTIGVEWPAGTGAADVVLLGSDGVLTIVETKLKKNPEARREVIAQLLEYAAYLSEWTIYEIQRRADDFLRSESSTSEFQLFDDVLRSFAKTEDEPVESLKGKIERNLREGRIRLIVAVDEVGEHAQKIVTFLNSYSSFDLYLLQISSYEDGDGRQTFVPSLFGYARKVSSTARGPQWDERRFAEHLAEGSDESTQAYTMKVYELFKDLTQEPVWGTGTTYGSFGLIVFADGRRVNLASIASNGTLQINFGAMSSRIPTDVLQAFADALGGIRGIALPADVSRKWPSIPKTVLRDPARLERVCQAIRSVVEQIVKGA